MKKLFHCLWIVCLVTAPAVGFAAELWPDPRLSTSCFIQASPFYRKLQNAGVFNLRAAAPAQSQKPVAVLFRTARSFHYVSDKKGHDRWQTADETSRSYGGDCEDKAIWLYTQMLHNGYRDVSLMIGKYGPTSIRFHMWVTYTDESGERILLDPTIQKKPWREDAFPEKLYRPMHILSGEDCLSL